MPGQAEPLAYSLRGAARAVGLSVNNLSAAVACGSLPAARVGKRRLTVLRAALERWIASHAVRGEYDPAVAVEKSIERRRASRCDVE